MFSGAPTRISAQEIGRSTPGAQLHGVTLAMKKRLFLAEK
jgi:hypothetical protein